MRDRRLQRTLRRMQRSTALSLLSATHAQILELVDDGLGVDDIALRLNLHPTAVPPLLRIARAKLAALTALDEPPDGAPVQAHEHRPDHQRRQ